MEPWIIVLFLWCLCYGAIQGDALKAWTKTLPFMSSIIKEDTRPICIMCLVTSAYRTGAILSTPLRFGLASHWDWPLCQSSYQAELNLYRLYPSKSSHSTVCLTFCNAVISLLKRNTYTKFHTCLELILMLQIFDFQCFMHTLHIDVLSFLIMNKSLNRPKLCDVLKWLALVWTESCLLSYQNS